MSSGFDRDQLLVGSEDHYHVSSIEFRRRLDLCGWTAGFGDAFENLHSQLGVRYFTPSEHDRDLDFVPVRQELTDLTRLGIEVTASDLGAILHFLDYDVGRLLAGLFLPLGEFITILPVVENLADGWVGLRSDLDQVEFRFSGQRQRFWQGFDPEL